MTQIQEATPPREPKLVAVRKAQKADHDRLSAVMARAFDDDPFANWVVAQDRQRAQRLYNFMALAIKMLDRHDEMYTTEDIEGGAIWAPPGKWRMNPLRQITLLPGFIRVTSAKRLLPVMAGMNVVEKKHPHAPHYYLLGLGVEPSLQGIFIGTQLMQPVLQRCDQEGIPAYLESSKARNVPMYERNGFRVTEEVEIPNGGPKIWLMWRDPR